MHSHKKIDDRSLALAKQIVAHIDQDPQHKGLLKAQATCKRWQSILTGRGKACADEWALILQEPWETIRSILLDTATNATRLRQNSPFCGVLTSKDRWRIIKEYRNHDSRAA